MPLQGTVVNSLINPWAVQSRIGTSSARYALNGMIMPVPNLSYIDYRSGVFASGDTGGEGGSGHMAMKVKPGGGMSVTVEMGNCVINTPNQGAYMSALDSKKTLTLASSGTTTARCDLIIARVYDDQNSALASASDVRKFTVEVYQGDPVSSTNVPIPTPNFAGYIPLAAVLVRPAASSVQTADITDMRGPGLVARGGMRGLYGADARPTSNAFKEAGAYPGDQRWVHSNGFQHQVYYGSGSDPTRSGWRGVHNCLVYNANPAPGALWWNKGQGTTIGMATVRVPYPGTPFMIYPTGRAVLLCSPNVSGDLRVGLHTATGPLVNWTNFNTLGVGTGDYWLSVSCPPVMWGPFTADLDVVLSFQIGYAPPNNGVAFTGSDLGNLLSVCVYPSTVQPPAA